jgi:predicted HicB family RNase H-like nuclease
MTNRSNSVLSVQLGSLKQHWVSYCSSRGISPSEATRQVIRKLIAREPRVANTPHAELPSASRTKTRVEVRVTLAEHQAVSAIATAEGFSVNLWIVALIRARLSGSP